MEASMTNCHDRDGTLWCSGMFLGPPNQRISALSPVHVRLDMAFCPQLSLLFKQSVVND